MSFQTMTSRQQVYALFKSAKVVHELIAQFGTQRLKQTREQINKDLNAMILRYITIRKINLRFFHWRKPEICGWIVQQDDDLISDVGQFLQPMRQIEGKLCAIKRFSRETMRHTPIRGVVLDHVPQNLFKTKIVEEDNDNKKHCDFYNDVHCVVVSTVPVPLDETHRCITTFSGLRAGQEFTRLTGIPEGTSLTLQVCND